MKTIELNYNVRNGNAKVVLEIQHKEYGTVMCSVNIKTVPNIKATLRKVNVLGLRIPQNEHASLIKELKNNEEIFNFSKGSILQHIQSLEHSTKLTVTSVFILSADTKYIRDVRRNGSNLYNIEETQKEEHKLFLFIEFEELSEKIYFTMKYNDKKKYTLKVVNEDKDKISNFLYPNWNQELLDTILPIIKEKVNFLLP